MGERNIVSKNGAGKTGDLYGGSKKEQRLSSISYTKTDSKCATDLNVTTKTTD